MDIDDIRELVSKFAAERDWEQFHSVRNLLLALVGEVGEAAEIVQWTEDSDIPALLESGGRERLAAELADVLVYLVRLADRAQIDLSTAVRAKIAENAAKYPVERARGSSRKYTELGQEPRSS